MVYPFSSTDSYPKFYQLSLVRIVTVPFLKAARDLGAAPTCAHPP